MKILSRCKKRIFFLCALFCYSGIILAATPQIVTWQTKNGAKVFFVATKQLPMLDLRVVFKAGSAYDGATPGIAALVNSLMNEGTETSNADQIANAFEKVGAQFSDDADREKSYFSLRTLTDPNSLSPAVKMFSEILSSANFAADSIVRIKNQTIASIREKNQDPDNVAQNQFYEALYGDHPYGHPVSGTEDSVSKITREQLLDFYHQFYVTKNAKVILVGDLTLEQAKQIAEEVTKNLSTGQEAPILKMATPVSTGITRQINYPTQQTTLWLGQLGINYQNPDYYGLAVGNQVLGGADLTSLLLQAVREKRGLAYFVFSQFVALQYRGPFFIRLQTRADQTAEALKVARETLKHFIEEGPTDDQFVQAKKNIIGRFPLSFASNNDILTITTLIAFYNLPLDYLQQYRSKINAVTREQVRAAFQRTLQFDKMVAVMVGPNGTAV
jgi:zinc protease